MVVNGRKRYNLDFVHFCTPPAGRKALMRNFNSQEGVFKPILRIKIAPESLPFQQSGCKNAQSRDNREKRQQMAKKIYRALALILLCSASPFHLEAATLGQKFEQAQPGDYIVTAQDGNYSLLFLRSLGTRDVFARRDLRSLPPDRPQDDRLEKLGPGQSARTHLLDAL